MVCHIAKQIGMNYLRRNVLLAGFPSKRATGGSRRSTITTTVSASTARCAKRTSKDRAFSPKEVDHFVKLTPARSPQIIYNSDTVYSTTTFRPVSPSPITPPNPNTPSPQRTRKLETPLHFDGGLFSDIRSADGKLLSKVTIDRVQSSTQHDITDSPSAVCMQEGKNYVDAIMKTETITNKDVFTVKFTPVPPELESPWLLTPSQYIELQSQSPVEYFKGNQELLRNGTEAITDKEVFETIKLTPGPPELDSLRLLTPSQFIKIRSQSPVAFIKEFSKDNDTGKCTNQELLRDGTETITNKEVVETIKLTSGPLELDSPRLLTPSQFIKIQSESPVAFIKELTKDSDTVKCTNQELLRDGTDVITNREVVETIQFTPVPPELDSPQLLAPSQFMQLRSQSPIEYIKDNYIDLQSYKIVNSLCKEKLLDSSILASDKHKIEKTVKFNVNNGNDIIDHIQDKLKEKEERLFVIDEPYVRGHSPLENIFVSEQLTKLNNYLQESLDVCQGRKGTPTETLSVMKEDTPCINHRYEEKTSYFENSTHVVSKSNTKMEGNSSYQEPISKEHGRVETDSKKRDVTNEVELNSKRISKLSNVPKRKAGIINAIYNMPIHYHAVIICAILIIYNLIYQYIKQSSQDRKK